MSLERAANNASVAFHTLPGSTWLSDSGVLDVLIFLAGGMQFIGVILGPPALVWCVFNLLRSARLVKTVYRIEAQAVARKGGPK